MYVPISGAVVTRDGNAEGTAARARGWPRPDRSFSFSRSTTAAFEARIEKKHGGGEVM